MSIREKAREAMENMVFEVAQKTHEMYYWKMHIWRDGDVTLDESINQSDDIIDSQADHFCPVQSVITVGTGSCACNCDYCNNVGTENADMGGNYFETVEEMEQERDANADTSWIEEQMEEEFDRIPEGYFDDEVAK